MAKFWAKAATVITAAGPDQLAFVEAMGADVAFDYTQVSPVMAVVAHAAHNRDERALAFFV
jgi:NADPH:quinone reductase-like Zn-dependent oxidoreductase